jgi:hypothetical protein
MRGLKLWLVAAVAALLIAGGGYYGYKLYIRNQFQAGLDQALAQLPPGYSAKYASVSYSALSGHGAVTGFTLHKDAPEGFDLAIDRVDVDHPNLSFGEAWAQAAKNPSAIAPETAIPLATRVIATGVTLHADAVAGTIGSVDLAGGRLYPWSLLQPGVPSWPEAMAALREPNPAANPEALHPLLRLMAAGLLVQGYDRITEKDFAVTITMRMPQRALPVTMSEKIRLAEVSGAERGVIAAASGEGYEVRESPGIDFSIAHMNVGRIDARKPLTAVLTQSRLTKDAFDGLTIGRMAEDGIKISVGGAAPVAIGEVSVAGLVFSGPFPIAADYGVSGVEITRAAFPTAQGKAALERLDLDRLDVSAQLKYRWDLARQTLAVSPFTLKFDQLGSFELSFELDDIVPGDATMALRARLGHALLRYTDRSLVARLIRAGAAQAQMDPDAYRQRLIEMVEARVAPFPDSAVLQAAARQIMTFLGDPKALKIELAPPSPMPALALLRLGAMPPPQAAAALGLGVTANQ